MAYPLMPNGTNDERDGVDDFKEHHIACTDKGDDQFVCKGAVAKIAASKR